MSPRTSRSASNARTVRPKDPTGRWVDTTDIDQATGIRRIRSSALLVEYGTHELRLVVHRLHGVDNTWFGSCYDLGLRDIELTARDLDYARKEWLDQIAERARTMNAALQKLLAS